MPFRINRFLCGIEELVVKKNHFINYIGIISPRVTHCSEFKMHSMKDLEFDSS